MPSARRCPRTRLGSPSTSGPASVSSTSRRGISHFCDKDGLRGTGRLARVRPHFGALLRNCVQVDQVGQVSVAPGTEAPRTGNRSSRKTGRRSFRAPAISDHYDDGCLVFGIPPRRASGRSGAGTDCDPSHCADCQAKSVGMRRRGRRLRLEQDRCCSAPTLRPVSRRTTMGGP
jgi:hypothetical protein